MPLARKYQHIKWFVRLDERLGQLKCCGGVHIIIDTTVYEKKFPLEITSHGDVGLLLIGRVHRPSHIHFGPPGLLHSMVMIS